MFRLFSYGGNSGSTTPSTSRHGSSTSGNSRHSSSTPGNGRNSNNNNNNSSSSSSSVGSSSSHSSSYTVVAKESESRAGGGGATPRIPGLAPNLASSATFDEKSMVMSAPVAALDIPTLAEAATISLDRAEQQIKYHYRQLGASADVDAHVRTLAEVRRIVQQVGIVEDLQTPPVLAALKTLSHHTEALEICTTTSPFSLSDLDKVMYQVKNALQNLENRLPVDRNVVRNNQTHGMQLNAALGGIANRRGFYNNVEGNTATTESSFQLNAPVYEGGKDMFAALLAAQRAAPVS